MGKNKWNFKKCQNSIILKDLLALGIVFFQVHLGNSKKIEIDSTCRLQSKNPWKSGWILHFNKRINMEY